MTATSGAGPRPVPSLAARLAALERRRRAAVPARPTGPPGAPGEVDEFTWFDDLDDDTPAPRWQERAREAVRHGSGSESLSPG